MDNKIRNHWEDETGVITNTIYKIGGYFLENGMVVIGKIKKRFDTSVMLECPAVLMSSENGQLGLAPFILTILGEKGDVEIFYDKMVATTDIDENSVIGEQYKRFYNEVKAMKGSIIVANNLQNVISLNKFKKEKQ